MYITQRMVYLSAALALTGFLGVSFHASATVGHNSNIKVTKVYKTYNEFNTFNQVGDKRFNCANALAGTTTAHSPHGKSKNSLGMSGTGGCMALNYKRHNNGWAFEAKVTEERDAVISGAIAW